MFEALNPMTNIRLGCTVEITPFFNRYMTNTVRYIQAKAVSAYSIFSARPATGNLSTSKRLAVILCHLMGGV